MPEVATYVIETADVRLELQDIVEIGYGSLNVTVGEPVIFAVQKKTVYVRDAKGSEHKLRLLKSTVKRARDFKDWSGARSISRMAQIQTPRRGATRIR